MKVELTDSETRITLSDDDLKLFYENKEEFVKRLSDSVNFEIACRFVEKVEKLLNEEAI